MGLMIGPAVPPVTFCLTWSGLSYNLCHQNCLCLAFYVCHPAREALQDPSRPCSAAAALVQPRTAVRALPSLVRSCRNKATRAGAVSGALSGISCGLTAWLVYAKVPPPVRLCTQVLRVANRTPGHCYTMWSACACALLSCWVSATSRQVSRRSPTAQSLWQPLARTTLCWLAPSAPLASLQSSALL